MTRGWTYICFGVCTFSFSILQRAQIINIQVLCLLWFPISIVKFTHILVGIELLAFVLTDLYISASLGVIYFSYVYRHQALVFQRSKFLLWWLGSQITEILEHILYCINLILEVLGSSWVPISYSQTTLGQAKAKALVHNAAWALSAGYLGYPSILAVSSATLCSA